MSTLPQIPTTDDEAEVRRPIYRDVEGLITRGFLSESVEVAGVGFSLRSLGSADNLLLQHRLRLGASVREWKEWVVASATWMIDGQVLLEDINAPRFVRQSVRAMPLATLDSLFAIYTSLHNRMSASISRTEAFCYEQTSRALWRMVGPRILHGESPDGPPQRIGMNPVQRIWVACNQAEDARVLWLQQWAAAKLVASAHAPKGIRKLNLKDESTQKAEEERRKRVMRETYYRATGRRLEDDLGGYVVVRAVTSEELVAEMERALRGEKDAHDIAVDEFKDRIRQRFEAERREHQERMSRLGDVEVGVTSSVDPVGMTLQQYLEAGGTAPRGTSRVVVDTAEAARLYGRLIEHEPAVGGIGMDGRARVVSAPEEPSLDAMLSGRRLTLSDDDGGR